MISNGSNRNILISICNQIIVFRIDFFANLLACWYALSYGYSSESIIIGETTDIDKIAVIYLDGTMIYLFLS